MPVPSDPNTGYIACPPATGGGFATSQTSTPKLLALLLALLNGTLVGSGGASGGIPVVLSSSGGKQRTPGFINAVASGTVIAGAASISFSSSSDFAGTILGNTFGASQAVAYSPPGPNDTIGAIAYTVSAGTLYIATLT